MILRRLRNVLPITTKVALAQILLHPIFDYCQLVLSLLKNPVKK